MNDLQLKIRTSELQNSFAVYECTGAYSSHNSHGWGIKNPKIEDVTEAYFEVFTPESLVPIKINVFPDFPTTGDYGYEVLPSKLGMKFLESGTYKINYVVIGKDKDGVQYTRRTTAVSVFINNAQCCVDKLIKNVDQNGFSDRKQRIGIELNALLSVVKRVRCKFPWNVQKILKHINLQCQCGGC